MSPKTILNADFSDLSNNYPSVHDFFIEFLKIKMFQILGETGS